MELYVLAGGQMDALTRWQQDLNAQFLPLYQNGKKADYKDGGLTHRRILVAPVQLFKIGFPKEEYQNVVNMVCPKWSHVTGRYRVIRKAVNMLRRVLGLKKAIKPTDLYPFTQPNPHDKSVFVVPIGTKPDAINDNGVEQI